MDVKLIPLDNLIPLEGNSKRHDTENTIKSILEYGYRDYIEVDTVFDPPRIVCGGDRRKALLKLREDNKPIEGIIIKDEQWLVPCIVKKSASEEDAIRYSIDNNLSTIKGANLSLEDELKMFDEELIKEQLSEVDTIVGWDSDTIDFILNEVENGEKKDDSEPESSTQEIDPEDYEFDHECPKCGFEW